MFSLSHPKLEIQYELPLQNVWKSSFSLLPSLSEEKTFNNWMRFRYFKCRNKKNSHNCSTSSQNRFMSLQKETHIMPHFPPSCHEALPSVKKISNLVSRNQARPHSHAARKAVWFTMATASDGINSQMMLRIVRESKMDTLAVLGYYYLIFCGKIWEVGAILICVAILIICVSNNLRNHRD